MTVEEESVRIESPLRHRWKATVTYRTNSGSNEVIHYMEELDELHDLVEAGPHWETISDIRVVFIKNCEGPITVEQAQSL